MPVRKVFFLVGLVAGIWAGSGTIGQAQDEKVYRTLTPEQMENMLRGMKLEYKKSTSRTEGIYYYDFLKDKHSVRLHFFRGKDIMLDVLFKEYPLEILNRWNVQAKFSRVALHKDTKGEFTALETNLDLLGGVTENTIRQFFKTFEGEISAFEKFASGGGILVAGDDGVLPSLTSEKLESTLKNLNLAFQKKALKTPESYCYDYESKGFKIRLTYFGGRDLMLDAIFKKQSLENLNQYNFQRKFIRAVQYNQNGQEYAALETNLDCTAGISENMIRHFILTFDEEVQAFSNYLANK